MSYFYHVGLAPSTGRPAARWKNRQSVPFQFSQYRDPRPWALECVAVVLAGFDELTVDHGDWIVNEAFLVFGPG